MNYKTRAIVPKNDGSDRIEYYVVDAERGVRSCSPIVWSKLSLEDRTPDRIAERAAKVRYTADRAKRAFGRQVEDNQWLRANRPPEDRLYRALCEHLGIRY